MNVLIIDDDESTCNVIQDFLKEEGFDCTAANDGKTGIELLKKNEFDRIILDMSMPEFSGMDFIRELQNTGLTDKTKIIIYTGVDFTQDEQVAIKKNGVSAYLSKDKGMSELCKVVSS